MVSTSEIYYPSDAFDRLFVKSIWRIHQSNAQNSLETILPKGTVEIIFNLSGNIIYQNSSLGIRTMLPQSFINGINFKPFNLIKSGPQLFLGIQLDVIGLKVLFDASVKEFNNNIVEGNLVCKSFDTLTDQLFETDSFKKQVQIIMKWIHQKTAGSKSIQSLQQAHCLFYTQRFTELTVRNFCKNNFLSDRQVRRLSSEWLGMCTETFLHYNRYLTALVALHAPKTSLTQIGLEAGYYDQSHFIREFRTFTDLTPKAYQLACKQLPGHIFA